MRAGERDTLGLTVRILLTIVVSILIVVVAWVALFTTTKLHKMAAIRGWVPGAIYKEHTITDKRVLDGEYGPAYWIAWEGVDITRRSTRRENLDEEQWRAINIGDRVAMAYYGNEPEPYKPDGIYVSTGNFIFDVWLLIIEILTIITLGWFLIRQWRKTPSSSLNSDAQKQRTG